MAATRRKHRLAAGILFLVYFVVLFYFLFFSEKMGRTYSERAYHYNLVPLKEIARFVKYWRVLGMKAVHSLFISILLLIMKRKFN